MKNAVYINEATLRSFFTGSPNLPEAKPSKFRG